MTNFYNETYCIAFNGIVITILAFFFFFHQAQIHFFLRSLFVQSGGDRVTTIKKYQRINHQGWWSDKNKETIKESVIFQDMCKIVIFRFHFFPPIYIKIGCNRMYRRIPFNIQWSSLTWLEHHIILVKLDFSLCSFQLVNFDIYTLKN